MLRIGLVAGEPSGDFLAAELIKALKRRQPDLEVEGVGGEKARLAGCRLLFSMEKLAVMGLLEVLGGLRELRALRRRLAKHFLRRRPDVFIGVDAPDFNLDLERTLKKNGVKTVHYVSPKVWAWRAYRTRKIRQAADLTLAVFPFEPAFLESRGAPARFVGHPLADQARAAPDQAEARRRLGLPPQEPVVAVLPGSRAMELRRLIPPFVDTAAWLQARHKGLRVVSNVLDGEAERQLAAQARRRGASIRVFRGRMAEVLAAADAALLASGTASLEAMLHQTPMVVAYRMNRLSYPLIRALVGVEFAALPNLLAGRELAPEFFQSQCRAEVLGPAVARWLEDPDGAQELKAIFAQLRQSLGRDASEQAADAVLSVAGRAGS